VDDDNLIVLQRFTLKVAIDQSNLDLIREQLTRLLDQVDPGTSLEPSKVAGLPALTGELQHVPSVEGGQSKLTFFFDGDQEYLINCQSTPSHRDEVTHACDLALTSLKLK
jgi:hypothetical protein